MCAHDSNSHRHNLLLEAIFSGLGGLTDAGWEVRVCAIDGFSAASEGSAIDDGQVGKPIRVKTAASAAPLVATVVGAGIVRIRSQPN